MTTINLNEGALAPVKDEIDLVDLIVTGNIPPELNGMLVRNGPNPLEGRFQGNDVLSWWPEPAMLHGISFQHGRVTGYRNRWLRTQRWGSVYSPTSVPSLLDTNPNVNVLHHAGEILALAEGGIPLAITTELDTVGAPRRHSGLDSGMCAHPKVDPKTGELISFRANWEKPWLRYGVTNADGSKHIDLEIDVPAPSMIHDMAITASHSIVLDLNVAYDFSMLARGIRIPIRWYDERKSRLGVIPRHGGDVLWFDIAPCFIMHVVNAYNEGDSTIVLDAVRYPFYFRMNQEGTDFEENPLGVLWRYTLNLKTGSVTETSLSDINIEMPRINENRTGHPYQFLYATEQPTTEEMRGVIRYDLASGLQQRFQVPKGDSNSEPIFVPRPGSTEEDDGWLLVCVYRCATDTSDIVILDAKNIASEPIATVKLPRRIPAGFHGTWINLTNGPK